MTPIGLDVRKQLEAEFAALNRERITYWLMNFKERGVNVDPGGGRSKISISGVVYEGQVADIFWGSIEPSLTRIISEAFKQAQFDGNAYAQSVGDRALDEVASELKGLVAKTYAKMAEVDRGMRGNGYPSRVPIKDTTADLERWNGEIDQLRASIKQAREEGRPKGVLRLFHWMERNKLLAFALAIFTAAVGITATWITNLIVSAPPVPPPVP